MEISEFQCEIKTEIQIFAISFEHFRHVLPVATGRSNFKCPKKFSIHNLNNTSLKTDELANLFGGSMMDEVA